MKAFNAQTIGFDYKRQIYTSGDLSNTDTGAIGGLDTDGGIAKTAESVVPNGAMYDEDPLDGFTAIWEDLRLTTESTSELSLQVGASVYQAIDISTVGIST